MTKRRRKRNLPMVGRPVPSLSISPLGWPYSRDLATRRQFDAGERLRGDRERAQLPPRTTMAWDAAPVSGRRGGTDADVDLSGWQIDAKRRFHSAIDAAGPRLADILSCVVCSGAVCARQGLVSASQRERGSQCLRSRWTVSPIITGSLSSAIRGPCGRFYRRASLHASCRSTRPFSAPTGVPEWSGRACYYYLCSCRYDCALNLSHAMSATNECAEDNVRDSTRIGRRFIMILFGSTLSPFVRKVAAYMREKGLDFDLQPTGFPNPTSEFCAASPFKKMPALQDGDYCLADSSA